MSSPPVLDGRLALDDGEIEYRLIEGDPDLPVAGVPA